MHMQHKFGSGIGSIAAGSLGEVPKQFWGSRGLSKAGQEEKTKQIWKPDKG